MKRLILTLLLAFALALPAWGQTTLNSTTLSAALDGVSRTVSLTSAANLQANDVAFVDREAMRVLSVDSTNNRITVQRGMEGTVAVRHASGAIVYADRPDRFINKDLAGACTAGAEFPNFVPLINLSNGNRYRCTNSLWNKEVTLNNLHGTSDNNPLRLNSRNVNNTSGDAMAFQSQPSQATTSTGTIFGAQIGPRLNDGIAAANVIGLHVDTFLRGTTAATTSGDVRALQLELTTVDAGTRTISGNVNFIRMRAAFSATTITGSFIPIRIEKAEAQTNSQQYTHILDVTGTQSGIWDTTGTPTTAAGYLKVRINGLDRWIQVYSTTP